MSLCGEEYYKLLRSFDFEPASYKKIAGGLMSNGIVEMYHALVHEEDISLLFGIPNLTIFWCCRCHLVADDGSTAHEHLHALVQYESGHTHQAFKKRLQRAERRFHKKTTFKKVVCPDHAVGVLRYITCEDGEKKGKRDRDGLLGAPHTHYCRSVFDRKLLHGRSGRKGDGCQFYRRTIIDEVTAELSPEWLNANVSKNSESGEITGLHHHDTCCCDYGAVGMEKKRQANERRRAFYSTEAGKKIKKTYKDKMEKKRQLVKMLAELGVNKKAELQKEKIITLLRLL